MAIARRVLGPIKTKLPLSSLADDLPRRLAFAGESSDPAFGLRQSLLDNLRQARWRAGQKLPPERQMCALYSVSRSTVRRVLAELKALGLITQKVGSGTYVAEDVAERLPEDAAEPASISPAELMEARLAFEPSLIDLVIRNGTATDFSELETCCRNGDVAPSLEVFEYWDGLFHQKLAQATHNSFVLTVFALISKMRDNAEWGLLKRKSATPERRANYQREHWAVLAALRNRDADTARHALLEHLRNVRRNMFTP